MVKFDSVVDTTPYNKRKVEYKVFKMGELEEYLTTKCKNSLTEAFKLGRNSMAYNAEYDGEYGLFDENADYVLTDKEGTLYSAYAGEVKDMVKASEVEAIKTTEKVERLIKKLTPVDACALVEDCDLYKEYGVKRRQEANLDSIAAVGLGGTAFKSSMPYVIEVPEQKKVVGLTREDLASRVRRDPAPLAKTLVKTYVETGEFPRPLTDAMITEYLAR